MARLASGMASGMALGRALERVSGRVGTPDGFPSLEWKSNDLAFLDWVWQVRWETRLIGMKLFEVLAVLIVARESHFFQDFFQDEVYGNTGQ